MLSERERLARDEFNDTQNEMQAWLEEIEAERVDVHYDGVGLLGRIRFWLTEGGEKKLVDEPDQEVRNFVETLRKVQALPGRGAWFWSHLWMEMPEGVLHQESDWMCEPDMGTSGFYVGPDGLDIRDGGPDLGEYKTELDRYPRDQDFIPDWLRDKVERWRLERGSVVARRIVELREESRLEREECL